MKSTVKNIELPETLIQVMGRLRAAGHQVYTVGGGVRNALLNRPVEDWDLATGALPAEIQQLFPDAIPTGLKHGTLTVRQNGDYYEVTTFRTESDYKDGRHPERVEFVHDIVVDLSRRDFTINAMAYSPSENGNTAKSHACRSIGHLIDPWGGQKDLKRRRLVAVGNADQRFSEDGLRLMRAARFAAELSFQVEDATLKSMRRHAVRIQKISAERIREELRRILLSAEPALGLQLLITTGVLKYILPELFTVERKWRVALKWLKNLQRLNVSQRQNLAMMLAAFFQSLRVVSTLKVMRRLRFSNREIEAVVRLLRNLDLKTLLSSDEINARKLIIDVGLKELPTLMRLYDLLVGQSPKGDPRRRYYNRWRRFLMQLAGDQGNISIDRLHITGDDVMNWTGSPPGALVGERLQRLLEFVWVNPQANERECLQQYMIEHWRLDIFDSAQNETTDANN